MVRDKQQERLERGEVQVNIDVNELLLERVRYVCGMREVSLKRFVSRALVEHLQRIGQFDGLEFLPEARTNGRVQDHE